MRLILASGLLLTLAVATSATAQPKQKKATTAAPVAATAAPVYVAPAAPATSAAPAVDAFRAPEIREIDGRTHGGFKWDAFVDAELTIPNKTDLNGATLERGFTVNDAALFLSKDFGRATALVELPFSSDLSGGSDSLNFAAKRAQAYVQVNKWQPVMLRFGQYASFFGVEANDSRDRLLADWGFVKNLIVPKTHTGVQLGYQTGTLALRAQIADQADRNAMGQENPEYAVFGRFDAGPGYGALGVSYQDTRTVTTTLNKTNMLVDVMGGLLLNKVRLDGEIDIKKSAGTDKTANSFAVFGSFPLDNELAIGARVEYLKDVLALAVPYDSILSFAVGPAYKLQQDLTIRGDFTLGSLKTAAVGAVNGTEDTLFGLHLSLVAEL